MIAYLDNAATTKPCDEAITAVMAAMSEGYFNPSALYAPAIAAERGIERVRAQIRAAIGAREGAAVLFTSGGTEANNLAILGAASALYGPQHILTCQAEHASVRAPFDALKGEGHRVTALALTSDGSIPYDRLEAVLQADPPALISLMVVNNEMGAVLDLQRLGELRRRLAPGALIHVDGVQGFMRLAVDMRQMDLFTLSAHKIHGPKGIGALVVNPGVRLIARQYGGGQQGGLRPGTENVPGIMGLGGAIAHMQSLGDVSALLMGKKRLFYQCVMAAVPDAVLNGPAIEDAAPHIINMSFPGVRSEVMLHALEAEGIYCATGAACSSKKRALSPVLVAMGLKPQLTESALRFSFCPDTGDDQIEYAAACIARQYALLKRFKRR